MLESFEESGSRLRINPDGSLRSKGFGFVEFTEHIHALAALRKLNNNPEYANLAFGGPGVRAHTLLPSVMICCSDAKRLHGVSQALSRPVSERPRLIVEFTVENKGKLKEHERREQSAKRKAALAAPTSAEEPAAQATPDKARNRQKNGKRGPAVSVAIDPKESAATPTGESVPATEAAPLPAKATRGKSPKPGSNKRKAAAPSPNLKEAAPSESAPVPTKAARKKSPKPGSKKRKAAAAAREAAAAASPSAEAATNASTREKSPKPAAKKAAVSPKETSAPAPTPVAAKSAPRDKSPKPSPKKGGKVPAPPTVGAASATPRDKSPKPAARQPVASADSGLTQAGPRPKRQRK